MNIGGGGIARLAPLLPASLLLHLAVILALTFAGRQATRSGYRAPDMSVEYVESRTLGADHSGSAARRHDTMPERKRNQAGMPAMKAAPEPLSGLIPAAGITSRQGASQSAPVSPFITQAKSSESGIGLNSGSVPGGASAGAATKHQGALATVSRQPRGDTPVTVPLVSPHLRDAYHAQLKRLIEAHKEYPLAARRSKREGSCERRFILARNGSLKHVEALSSCGHAFLDDAATRAIAAVGTFPPLPDVFNGAEEAFTITMTFTLAR